MMKKNLSILLIFTILIGLTGCSVRRAANMTNCDFSFNKVTGVTWAGIDFMKIGLDYKKLDAATIASCLSALTQKDFALHVDMDLNAVNPTHSAAGMAGFDYILYYKDSKLGEGTSTNVRDIDIPADGGKMLIPINFTLHFGDVVDLKHPMQSAEKVVGLIGSVAKIGKEESDITIKLRPHVRIAGNVVKGKYLKIGK